MNDTIISDSFDLKKRIVIFEGDCLNLFKRIPDRSIQLIITSPPYNIGKEYEKKLKLNDYLEQQKSVIQECERVLTDRGSICWQVGNYVDNGKIIPLESVLYPIFTELEFVMRNKIIWHFGHGLHCSKRFSGRYESIIWFTRDVRDYVFNLDPVRVPQKYPGKKYYKGPKAGQYSGNPLGKNPGDVWNIPNVKSNHIEKSDHPCQFPVELIERFVLSMTDENDWVLDPFLGTGTTIISAILHNRKGAGAERYPKYIEIAKNRVTNAMAGSLRLRPMNKPVYDPNLAGNKLTKSPWNINDAKFSKQIKLLDKRADYKSENS